VNSRQHARLHPARQLVRDQLNKQAAITQQLRFPESFVREIKERFGDCLDTDYSAGRGNGVADRCAELAGWAYRTRSAPGDRQGVGGASPLR
jgi:hypothetical protein